MLAVGHSLLVIFYHMLKSEVEYQDLGVEYFEQLGSRAVCGAIWSSAWNGSDTR